MTFLVDEQLSRRLAHLLTAANHDPVHTLDLPRRNLTSDDELLEICARANRILASKDLEFADSFLLKQKPSRLLLISTGHINEQRARKIISDTPFQNRRCVRVVHVYRAGSIRYVRPRLS